MSDYKLTEDQEKWLQMLETTDLPQGKKRLGNARIGYCCLAIACLALGIEFSSADKLLPIEAEKRLKTRSPSGRREDRLDECSLVDLNDARGFSFKQIAAAVRAEPEQYFYTK